MSHRIRRRFLVPAIIATLALLLGAPLTDGARAQDPAGPVVPAYGRGDADFTLVGPEILSPIGISISVNGRSDVPAQVLIVPGVGIAFGDALVRGGAFAGGLLTFASLTPPEADELSVSEFSGCEVPCDILQDGSSFAGDAMLSGLGGNDAIRGSNGDTVGGGDLQLLGGDGKDLLRGGPGDIGLLGEDKDLLLNPLGGSISALEQNPGFRENEQLRGPGVGGGFDVIRAETDDDLIDGGVGHGVDAIRTEFATLPDFDGVNDPPLDDLGSFDDLPPLGLFGNEGSDDFRISGTNAVLDEFDVASELALAESFGLSDFENNEDDLEFPRLGVTQTQGAIWVASRPGSVTFYGWDGTDGGALTPLQTILGPSLGFGDSFGFYTGGATDGVLARLRASQGNDACTGRCMWISSTGEEGEDSAVFIIDLDRKPPNRVIGASASLDFIQVITGIPNGHRGLSADMADLDGDGFPEIIIGAPAGSAGDLTGDPAASDESGVAYALVGPLTTGDLREHVARLFHGEVRSEQFGGDVSIGDLNQDGLDEIAITSRRFRSAGRPGVAGAVFIFLGAPPTIDAVHAADGQTTITGANLDGTVRIDGLPVAVLDASPSSVTVAGEGRVEMVGLWATVRQSERVVDLGPGFNLVGWTGDTPIVEALATVDGSFSGVFVWDPLAELFRSFNPDAPAFINDLEELNLGDGLWINIDDPDGATWTQPAFADARSVDLVPGLQIAIWTGPDGTPIEEALAGLPAAVIQILAWDVASGSFNTFNPLLPAALNTLRILNHGDAFWIEVAQGVTWEQPAPAVG